MSKIDFQIVQPADRPALLLIARWYFSEWRIPVESTIDRLLTVTADELQFQVLMLLDDRPVATGGIYDHVGLLDKRPDFKIYKKWLAMVYTVPGARGQGYGAAICSYIQEHAKRLGLGNIHLFTDTAASLYRRLGWQETEQLKIAGRHLTIMKKQLF